MLHGQKNQNIKQKQYHNKFNKDFKNDPHQKKKKNPLKEIFKLTLNGFLKVDTESSSRGFPDPAAVHLNTPFQQSLSFCHPKKVETNSNIGY